MVLMAQKTSAEFEKEFMHQLAGTTGKDLAAWLKTIDGFDSKKRNELIAWLKAEHKFIHMHASLRARTICSKISLARRRTCVRFTMSL